MLALAGMPLARPWGEQQNHARVGCRAHLVALLGSKCATKPQPPATVLPSSSTSTSPDATTIQARSWTWCSWSPSPASRLIAITRASGSLRRTSGWRGWTSSEERSQVSMPGNLISAWPWCGRTSRCAERQPDRDQLCELQPGERNRLRTRVIRQVGRTPLDRDARRVLRPYLRWRCPWCRRPIRPR